MARRLYLWIGFFLSVLAVGWSFGVHRKVQTSRKPATQLSSATSQSIYQGEFAYLDPSDDIDVSNLPPWHPRFIDMPWPEARSPEATAYGRHMSWKRSLSDGDRKVWTEWATSIRAPNARRDIEYNINDFISQKQLETMIQKAKFAQSQNMTIESNLWVEGIQRVYQQENEEVKQTLRQYYKAFNNRNLEQLRSFWLPYPFTELILPGRWKARGMLRIHSAYRRLFSEVSPFATVEPEIVQVQSFGRVVIAFVVERVKQGNDPRPLIKPEQMQDHLRRQKLKQQSSRYGIEEAPKYLLSLSVLRKAKGMWRFLTMHTTQVETSAFTDNAANLALLAPKEKVREVAAATKGKGKEKAKSRTPEKKKEEKEAEDTAEMIKVVRATVEKALQRIPATPQNQKLMEKMIDDVARQMLEEEGEDEDFEDDVEQKPKHRTARPSLEEFASSYGVSLSPSGSNIDVYIAPTATKPRDRSRLVLDVLREATNAGLLSDADRAVLVQDVVAAVSQGQVSFVENAVQVLLGVAPDTEGVLKKATSASFYAPSVLVNGNSNNNGGRSPVRTTEVLWTDDILHAFADQCRLAVKEIERTRAEERGLEKDFVHTNTDTINTLCKPPL